MTERSRRLKVLPVDDTIMLSLARSLLSGEMVPGAYLPQETLDAIKGAQVETVHYDVQRNCWVYMLSREDWPEVPLGYVVPFVHAAHQRVYIQKIAE